MRAYLLLVFLLLFGMDTRAQFPILNGNATSLGSDCFRITPDQLWLESSVWIGQLNIHEPFSITFEVNFGSKDQNGADGLAFVLQSQGSDAIGPAGGSMGYENIGNSLILEFDNYHNPDLGDPVYDHLAIQSNGAISHTGQLAMAGPVAMLFDQGNVEDGQDHLVYVDWNPATQLMQVRFDCELRLNSTLDMDQHFGGDSIVYWGFTGSTGGLSNVQTICLVERETPAHNSDFKSMCEGTTLAYSAPDSDGGWSWQPDYGIFGISNQNVLLKPLVDTVYTVAYTKGCLSMVDTLRVDVVQIPEVDLGPDFVVCPDSTVVKTVALDGGTYAWQDGSTSSEMLISSPGSYAVTVSIDPGCRASDSVTVDAGKLPTADLGPDTVVCLDAHWQKPLGIVFDSTMRYHWSDGSQDTAKIFTEPGAYWLSVSNVCGSVIDTVNIYGESCSCELVYPNVITPNRDGLNDEISFECEGTLFTLTIYSRWGAKLFEASEPNHLSWDGTHRSGDPVAAGTYFYILSSSTGEVHRGELQVLR